MTSPPDRRLEYLPLADLKAADRNPKRHDLARIRRSIAKFGCTTAGILDERTGRLVAGHGRVEALAAMRADGETPPGGIRADGADWLVPIVRGWASRSDAEAETYLVADNQLSTVGGWDTADLSALLVDLAAHDPDLVDLAGYDADGVDSLLADVAGQDAAEEYAARKGDAPSPRVLAMDAIFTITPMNVRAWIAHATGFKIGIQSSDRTALTSRPHWEGRFPMTFIDNEWHDYDHMKHVDFVAAFRPKYATVRDVMTRQQCREAGVTYYPLDRVLEMAADVARHADNVIVIPKYDCIADIPAEFMLGYSVPSSYGATPLPADRFAGRRVHLLGGPWRAQRTYLSLMGDDVVSLDFNHCLFEAKFGKYTLPDGGSGEVNNLGQYPTNAGLVAIALSLGNIGAAINEITTGRAPFTDVDSTAAASQEPAHAR